MSGYFDAKSRREKNVISRYFDILTTKRFITLSIKCHLVQNLDPKISERGLNQNVRQETDRMP